MHLRLQKFPKRMSNHSGDLPGVYCGSRLKKSLAPVRMGCGRIVGSRQYEQPGSTVLSITCVCIRSNDSFHQ